MEKKKWKRRDLLKSLGLATAAAPLTAGTMTAHSNTKGAQIRDIPSIPVGPAGKTGKPVTAVVIGAGSRGWGAYSSYGIKNPDQLQVVGVAEPIPYRRERMARAFNIPEKYQFVTWEHVFEVPKFADALIVTTPDDLHYGPAMAGLEMGYDMILEKVIAQTWKECNDILRLALKKDAIVAVCHVLRYNPYYRKLKEVVSEGAIGDIISVQHLEPVERIHMSHSFVRGNWGNAEKSNPMILSKSCHDTDLLRWIINRPCEKVSSFGSLAHFREDQAPPGSTSRCTDGCVAEPGCPYSALKIYLKKRSWLQHLTLEEVNENTILRELKRGPYGRCVYRCDNNVVDHQVSNFEFQGGITTSFSMEAHTHYGGRRTRIFGSEGDIVGDERTLVISNASTGEQEIWDTRKALKASSGHGGGDHGLVRDFVQAVRAKDADLLTSTIQVSMESHLMGFEAEYSRLQGGEVRPVLMNHSN